MDKNNKICMVTPVEKPRRKLIILRSIKAHDYWSFCEEKGCNWVEILNSIPNKLDVAAILELPESLVTKGSSKVAAGVEVPLDYQMEIPEEYEIVELEPCTMLYFQSESFTDENEFGAAIKFVYESYKNYNPNEYGYMYEDDKIPKFNFGASSKMGAKIAFPVRKL